MAEPEKSELQNPNPSGIGELVAETCSFHFDLESFLDSLHPTIKWSWELVFLPDNQEVAVFPETKGKGTFNLLKARNKKAPIAWSCTFKEFKEFAKRLDFVAYPDDDLAFQHPSQAARASCPRRKA